MLFLLILPAKPQRRSRYIQQMHGSWVSLWSPVLLRSLALPLDFSRSRSSLSTANPIFLSVSNAMSQCLGNDLLLKQIGRIRNSKTCHVFTSGSHDHGARQIWALMTRSSAARSSLSPPHNGLTKTLRYKDQKCLLFLSGKK